jgi:hypothetical protein
MLGHQRVEFALFYEFSLERHVPGAAYDEFYPRIKTAQNLRKLGKLVPMPQPKPA